MKLPAFLLAGTLGIAAGWYPRDAPRWRAIPRSSFVFHSYSTVDAPPVAAPYEFSLPYPTQDGVTSDRCDATENTRVDLYRLQSGAWTGPLSGPIYRTPTDFYLSDRLAGKGIAVIASFEGTGSAYNGNTLVQSIFYHDEPCYRASTEFGFDRYLKGLPDDGTVHFYYEIHANCKPDGKCRDHETGKFLIDQRETIALPATPATNSRGGKDWRYEAYLIDCGRTWVIRILDPYDHMEVVSPQWRTVQDFWVSAGRRYFEHGARGYVTATSTRGGPVQFSGEPPVMNVVKILMAE